MNHKMTKCLRVSTIVILGITFFTADLTSPSNAQPSNAPSSSDVPSSDANELEWTKYIAESKNGTHQYICPDQSRVDVLTDEYAYEVEWANKWKEAPTQAILYSMLTNKKPAVILLMRGNKTEKVYHAATPQHMVHESGKMPYDSRLTEVTIVPDNYVPKKEKIQIVEIYKKPTDTEERSYEVKMLDHEWQKEWLNLKEDQIAELKSFQGVKYPGLADLKVINQKKKKEVKSKGRELGEVYMRGNTVMMGYYKDKDTSNKIFEKGWFHTGDIAVVHKNNYIQIRDRSKDIIISGGENISSIEIENVLFKHPDIIDAAVVAKKDDVWGESPCAFVQLKENSPLKESQIIDFCKKNMAKFKVPKKIIFGDISKTSTGKTQKFLLRQIANKK